MKIIILKYAFLLVRLLRNLTILYKARILVKLVISVSRILFYPQFFYSKEHLSFNKFNFVLNLFVKLKCLKSNTLWTMWQIVSLPASLIGDLDQVNNVKCFQFGLKTLAVK